MSPLKNEPVNPLEFLGLAGLIHIWGPPAGGKTLFAVAAAASVAKTGYVEWLNCDGKRGFIRYLNQTVREYGGSTSHITLSFAYDTKTVQEQILALPNLLSNDVRLVVIDPVTRALDMARNDPILWGRELFEEILPTLAHVVQKYAINVLLLSESRVLIDHGLTAVHHKLIRRWSHHDIRIRRIPHCGQSEILCSGEKEDETVIGNLSLSRTGVVTIMPIEDAVYSAEE